ncbi:MAG: hypothetical protein Q4D58_06605 [Synergistaceae bacterium]|nr:hypothetical protein [Synergistaceae bacterium]
MKNILLTLAAMILIISAPRYIFAAECASGSQPLELLNKSGAEIISIELSQTGMEKWSPNRLDAPLADGASASCDIWRGEILGLSDLRVTLRGGKEIIWRRLPVLEIFSLTVNSELKPEYERIKLSS